MMKSVREIFVEALIERIFFKLVSPLNVIKLVILIPKIFASIQLYSTIIFIIETLIGRAGMSNVIMFKVITFYKKTNLFPFFYDRSADILIIRNEGLVKV